MSNKTNHIALFDGSYQISRVETSLEIPEHYVLYKLGELHEHKKGGKYWAEVDRAGTVQHYWIENGELIGKVISSPGRHFGGPL